MTAYPTCRGCKIDKQPCAAREAMRSKIAGLGVTSVKWKCADRVNRFEIGDALWASTVDDMNGGEPYEDDFPAIAVRHLGSGMLVYIAPGAPGRDHGDDIAFSPRTNGFCKIPLSRLTARDAPKEEVCRSCEQPASAGHIKGYRCNRETGDWS